MVARNPSLCIETMAMMEKLEKAQDCGINYGSEKSEQVKDGAAEGGAEAEGGASCETEFHEEAGELDKVGWTRGPNGMEKSKTATDIGRTVWRQMWW